jgi:MFS family permease
LKKIKRFDLVLFLALVSLANGLSMPVQSLYLVSIGIDPALLGLMFSVQMASLAVGESLLGFVSDKIGYKTIMYATPFFAIGHYLPIVFTRNVPLLFIGFAMSGLSIACSSISGRVYGATISTSEDKPFYMALVQTSFRISSAIGSFASGFISSSFSYLRVFQTSLGVLILPLLVLINDVRKKNGKAEIALPTQKSVSAAEPEPDGGRMRLPSAIVQAAAAVLIFVGHGLTQAFLPLLASDIAGASDKQVGVMYAMMGVLGAIFTVPTAPIIRRIGKEVAMTLGLLLCGISLAGMVLLPTFGWIFFFVIVNSFARPLFSIAALTLISDTLSKRRQGAGMGLYGLSEDIGLMIGSGLGGFVWAEFGYKMTFLMGSAAAISGILVVLFLLKYIKPRVQAERALAESKALLG